MTVLDKFVTFARELPKERLDMVEQALGTIMQSNDPDFDFDQAELAEIDRRLSAKPVYASTDSVNKLLRRS